MPRCGRNQDRSKDQKPSRGSNPSSTDTAPTLAMVDDDLQRLCRSDHQIVADTLDTHIAADGLDGYENHVS